MHRWLYLKKVCFDFDVMPSPLPDALDQHLGTKADVSWRFAFLTFN